MKNRNRGYIKRGTVIDVQITGEYFISANIVPINKDKTEFRCDLSIHDTESGISVELEKSDIFSSTYKTINKDKTEKLNILIDNGFFNDDVNDIENMLECLNALLELQRKLKCNKENK